jgi:hypothetical protein
MSTGPQSIDLCGLALAHHSLIANSHTGNAVARLTDSAAVMGQKAVTAIFAFTAVTLGNNTSY